MLTAAFTVLLLLIAACSSAVDDAATIGASEQTDEPADPGEAVDTPVPGDQPEPDHDSQASSDRAHTPCGDVDPRSLGSSAGTVMFFASCEDTQHPPYPVYRTGDSFDLDSRLAAMAQGLTAQERAAGLFSWFDPQDELTITAEVDRDGVAVLRFAKDGQRWRPGASTSAQTMAFVDPLAATVFAFGEVRGIANRSFCVGELACDGVFWRDEFEQSLFLNYGTITSPVCDLTGVWLQPDRCTVAGVMAAGPLRPATVVDVAADDALNVRAGPNAEAWIVSDGSSDDALTDGSRVLTTPVMALADDGGLWQLILQQPDQPTSAGWVNQAFLSTEPTAAELLAEGLIELALRPGDEAVAKLPFAADVELGLGSQLLVELDRAELADPVNWMLEMEYFRAATGPFSPMARLARVKQWQATEGPHNHCAGPPMPVPDGLGAHTIVSVQPLAATIDSCLQWFAVDLFIGDDEKIDAVTLDFWEP